MAKIHVMLGGTKVSEHPMESTPWVVGRHGRCHVQIENPSVSRRHCQFIHANGSYFVEDVGSANGTFVGGKRVRRAQVQNGMEISIGKYVLIFEDSGMELVPTQKIGGSAGKSAAGKSGFSGVERTFQMDATTLRQQMQKAGAAAAGAADQVRKATEVAEEFNLEAKLAERKPRRIGKYVIAAVTLIGVAVLAALVILAFYMVAGD